MRSLVIPILLFSSVSFHWSLRKAFLSLLALLWSYAFKWVYLFFPPLPLDYLLSSAFYKASSDSHFAFFQFFSFLFFYSLVEFWNYLIILCYFISTTFVLNPNMTSLSKSFHLNGSSHTTFFPPSQISSSWFYHSLFIFIFIQSTQYLHLYLKQRFFVVVPNKTNPILSK